MKVFRSVALGLLLCACWGLSTTFSTPRLPVTQFHPLPASSGPEDSACLLLLVAGASASLGVPEASPYLHKGPFLQQFSGLLLNALPASLQNPDWYPWCVRTFTNTPHRHASRILPKRCVSFTMLVSSWPYRMSWWILVACLRPGLGAPQGQGSAWSSAGDPEPATAPVTYVLDKDLPSDFDGRREHIRKVSKNIQNSKQRLKFSKNWPRVWFYICQGNVSESGKCLQRT